MSRQRLSLLLVAVQCLAFVLAAPTGDPDYTHVDDPSDGYVSFDFVLDNRQSVHLPAELQLKLLQEQRDQEDLEIVRMQFMQLNLLKLLIGLDIFIILCLYFYAREERTYRMQAV
ncbi:hypothetical protein KR018_011525 [Drosophila ironensis]|nr:hypothetical protein KR018_011525 [Drosophila ironensis]